ncbi:MULTISPECIES: Na/Pi cotransporter family protein [Sphaerochaeta]|jgi:phosphate:Na+ symporter|uniref:Na/Pi cotransporter family protein n=1 Tax=Sphaerochaeta TaxID=399320 RepID=UPI0025908496|nr:MULTISPECIES: Na/Pi cotransporter family protein [Sphaerochaeta]MDT3359454.1 Na/Pi cotransporter family protein [Spirochaetota bacterium]MDD3422891.1 Na/Pi cotransporter family protein [Sphaerochaeta sp.]MDD3457219.1 Na/Pi cotransporter family protein [Sphaerochaeta sp.]MDD4037000.1 Na/Pi cotransporter family protein [Sphaerochaeta sp.]MDD4449790.1 Na/Pi cotransporter family protein [Sphaerochaeta sp.]
MKTIVIFFQIVGSLGLFLFGIKLLSEGLQKSAGDKMKAILKLMTKNRFISIMTGLLITIIIQSSSATTVMVVSFVNAGLMGLTQAIGVILGANIGTTFTGWLVALLGFKVDITSLALVSIAFAAPMMFSKKNKTRDAADVLLGFGVLFLGLNFMSHSIPDITGNIEVLEFLATFNSDTLWMNMLCILLGTLVTIVVQSSSAAMAMTLTMAYNGWLGVTASAALILGSNIGTTITAYLASIGTSTTAKRAAWAHIFFNVVGSVIALILFHPLLKLVNYITPGDIYTLEGATLSTQLPLFLAMFHSVFNIMNTIIFFPFVRQYAHFIERLVPAKAEYDEGTYHFKYIGGVFIDSPEIYMLAIRDEIKKMANLACNMLTRYRGMFNNRGADIESDALAMKKDEDYADQMQEQLSDFCVHLLQDSQTPTNASSLNCLIRVMDELESVTDSCYNLTILSQRRYNQGWTFDEATDKDLREYQSLVQEFLDYVRDRMDRTLTKAEMQKANEFEEQINNQRNRLSLMVQERLSDGKADVRVELLILEKIRHLEHIGDYCTNIAEAYHQAVKHTPMLQKRSGKSMELA